MTEENLWVVPSQIDPTLDLDTIDPDDTETLAMYELALAACQSASQLLWALSGRKFHTGTTITEHYVADRHYVPTWMHPPLPGNYVVDGPSVILLTSADYRNSRIRLAAAPIVAVGSVTDLGDGRVLDPSEYRVVNHTLLEFNALPVKGVDVSYTHGQAPPALGRMAALHLARNFYYLWTEREDQCDLPDRVTSVNRQGVSWVLMDNQQYIDDLRTGVYVVDLFLRSVNPGKAVQKAKVFSVDIPRGRRRSA